MRIDKTVEAFFALLRAGLWEQGVKLNPFDKLDFSVIRQLAEEQSVVGLIVAGLEHVEDKKLAKQDVIQIVAQTLQLEQKNSAMNYFVGALVDKMRGEGIYALLLKGQGVANCYERPLWRSSGDIDFFFSEENYKSAKAYLIPLASSVEPEGQYKQHLGMTIDPWKVELHGNLRCGLSARVDRVMDEIKNDVFYGGIVRSWLDDNTDIFLLNANDDAVFLFTHILGHFYKGGIGVRQVCDWCRLLWKYRGVLNVNLLEKRIQKMGLMDEWKAFGTFVVDYLGLPSEAMPLYSPEKKWRRKAERICSFIIEVGNFGQNRDTSYLRKYPYLIRKTISFWWRVGDACRHVHIFPLDSIRFFLSIMLGGIRDAVRGE